MKSKFFPIAVLFFLLQSINFVAAQEEVEPKKKAADNLKQQDKLKELPEPDKISWSQNKKFGDQLFAIGSIYNGLHYYEAALIKNSKGQYQSFKEGSDE
jgi:hypothetical protein